MDHCLVVPSRYGPRRAKYQYRHLFVDTEVGYFKWSFMQYLHVESCLDLVMGLALAVCVVLPGEAGENDTLEKIPK